MIKHKFPPKLYILILLFLCHLNSVIFENNLYGNIFSPLTILYSSYLIYFYVIKRKTIDNSKIFLFFSSLLLYGD